MDQQDPIQQFEIKGKRFHQQECGLDLCFLDPQLAQGDFALKYLCHYCKCFVWQPLRCLQCDILFCFACCKRQCQSDNIQCIKCNQTILNQIHANTQYFVKDFEFSCPYKYKGCNNILKYEQLEEHFNSCSGKAQENDYNQNISNQNIPNNQQSLQKQKEDLIEETQANIFAKPNSSQNEINNSSKEPPKRPNMQQKVIISDYHHTKISLLYFFGVMVLIALVALCILFFRIGDRKRTIQEVTIRRYNDNLHQHLEEFEAVLAKKGTNAEYQASLKKTLNSITWELEKLQIQADSFPNDSNFQKVLLLKTKESVLAELDKIIQGGTNRLTQEKVAQYQYQYLEDMKELQQTFHQISFNNQAANLNADTIDQARYDAINTLDNNLLYVNKTINELNQILQQKFQTLHSVSQQKRSAKSAGVSGAADVNSDQSASDEDIAENYEKINVKHTESLKKVQQMEQKLKELKQNIQLFQIKLRDLQKFQSEISTLKKQGMSNPNEEAKFNQMIAQVQQNSESLKKDIQEHIQQAQSSFNSDSINFIKDEVNREYKASIETMPKADKREIESLLQQKEEAIKQLINETYSQLNGGLENSRKNYEAYQQQQLLIAAQIEHLQDIMKGNGNWEEFDAKFAELQSQYQNYTQISKSVFELNRKFSQQNQQLQQLQRQFYEFRNHSMSIIKQSSGQKIIELDNNVNELKSEMSNLKEKLNKIYTALTSLKNTIESGKAGQPPTQQQRDNLDQFLQQINQLRQKDTKKPQYSDIGFKGDYSDSEQQQRIPKKVTTHVNPQVKKAQQAEKKIIMPKQQYKQKNDDDENNSDGSDDEK